MNARQKAKYWKRKYEELASMPLNKTIAVTSKTIDTLRVERIYPAALVVDFSKSLIKETIMKDFAFEITDQIGRYVDYSTEFDPHSNSYRFSAKLNVVCK